MDTEFLQPIRLDADMQLKKRVATYYDTKFDRFITLGENNKFLSLMSDFESAIAMHEMFCVNRIQRLRIENKLGPCFRILYRNRSLDFSIDIITYQNSYVNSKYTTMVRVNTSNCLQRNIPKRDFAFSSRSHFTETEEEACTEHQRCVDDYIFDSSMLTPDA